MHKGWMVYFCRVAVSLDMVEEYDSFCKDFRKAVHENQDQGNLDLGMTLTVVWQDSSKLSCILCLSSYLPCLSEA